MLVNSFGNNRKTYIYAKDISDEKTELVFKIVNEEEEWRTYKKTPTYQQNMTSTVEKVRRLQQIERIQQIERVKQVDKQIYINSEDYASFNDLNGTIIYLDPPYENAANTYKTGGFDSKEFYNWAYEMSKNNIVIISSYEVHDERFEPVFEFETARSMLSSKGRGDRTEKLFMVKAGL